MTLLTVALMFCAIAGASLTAVSAGKTLFRNGQWLDAALVTAALVVFALECAQHALEAMQ